jgi:hypothetical protein
VRALKKAATDAGDIIGNKENVFILYLDWGSGSEQWGTAC